MNEADDTNELSLPQIICALILALIPFTIGLLAALAREGRDHTPEARRLTRHLGKLRLLATLFRADTTSEQTPARPGKQTRTARHHPAPPKFLPSGNRHRTPTPHVTPEPTRTLEL